MKKSEMAATIDRLRQEVEQLVEFRMMVADALMRPRTCQVENLTRHAMEDISYLKSELVRLTKENKELKEKIIMYQRSVEVGDDR